MNTPPSLIDRFAALPAEPPESSLILRAGTRQDYAALADHHYRAARPATMTRVLVLEHLHPSIAGRFLRRDEARAVVAVLVESLPALNSGLRDWAMRERYGSIRDFKARASVINREIRCISRVVVHPQWRGLGLAARLVRESLRTATTPVTEAFAAMGHVHPFFTQAGMTAHHRPPHACDARLIAALNAVGCLATDLAMTASLLARIAALPEERRHFVIAELTRWHRQTAGRSRASKREARDILLAARQRLLCEPVYFVRVLDRHLESRSQP